MDLETIVQVCISIMTFLIITLIPSIILMIKKWKQAKNAKTDAEKEAALNELNNEAIKLISEAEKAYLQVDELMKATNKSSSAGTGELKKKSVMANLQSFCIEKGVNFDKEYWNTKIDELVALTKEVNYKGE